MITLEMEQLSPEWFKEKAGKPSASSFDKIVTSKGETSTSVKKYLYQLAGERVLGVKEEGFQNGAMQRGIELEGEARAYYELITGQTVQKVGICYQNEDRKFSCSPDGLVGEEGLLQIKCPSLAVHVGYLIEDKLPVDYVQQVQGELFVTGRKWNDFISYYPGLKPLIVRVERDEAFISKLEAELIRFCSNLETVVKKISQE